MNVQAQFQTDQGQGAGQEGTTGDRQRCRDGGQRFVPLTLPVRLPVAAIHAGAQRLVLAGARGVHSLPLPKD